MGRSVKESRRRKRVFDINARKTIFLLRGAATGRKGFSLKNSPFKEGKNPWSEEKKKRPLSAAPPETAIGRQKKKHKVGREGGGGRV